MNFTIRKSFLLRPNPFIFRTVNNNRNRKFFNTRNVPSTVTYFQKFMQKARKLILKRVVIFRVIFYGSIILFIYTTIRYTNNTNYAQYTTPVYFLQNKAQLNAIHNVAGVVKPGSVEFIKGSDEMSFILTDFEHELKVYYKGPLPNNFTEGSTAVSTGSITDSDKPNIFISNKVMTNHSYNAEKWKSNDSFYLGRGLAKKAIKEENLKEEISAKIENYTKMK